MHLMPLFVLAAVFLLIAVRRIGRLRLAVWQVMLGGAVVVLLSGRISPPAALRSINPDVMLFLFGMFIVGQAMEESGFLSGLSYRLFRGARSPAGLLLRVLLVMGAASALLMNDTVAIIGTPVMLILARSHGLPPRVLLHALALAVTTGSVLSPIGNPQNLLIALEGGLPNPFVTFAAHLFLPTLVSLLLTLLALRLFYPDSFPRRQLVHVEPAAGNRGLARLCRISLSLILALIGIKIALVFLGARFDLPLTWIAVAGAVPVLLFSPRRMAILRGVDWPTLVFFAAMFVLMRSVWDSGLLQPLVGLAGDGLGRLPVILALGVFLSQLVSNVPLVALLLPVLVEAGVSSSGLTALAAGSTLAGNLLLMGAASNIIVIQNAEKRSAASLGFLEFARVGLPLTLAQSAVYWAFLKWL